MFVCRRWRSASLLSYLSVCKICTGLIKDGTHREELVCRGCSGKAMPMGSAAMSCCELENHHALSSQLFSERKPHLCCSCCCTGAPQAVFSCESGSKYNARFIRPRRLDCCSRHCAPCPVPCRPPGDPIAKDGSPSSTWAIRIGTARPTQAARQNLKVIHHWQKAQEPPSGVGRVIAPLQGPSPAPRAASNSPHP